MLPDESGRRSASFDVRNLPGTTPIGGVNFGGPVNSLKAACFQRTECSDNGSVTGTVISRFLRAALRWWRMSCGGLKLVIGEKTGRRGQLRTCTARLSPTRQGNSRVIRAMPVKVFAMLAEPVLFLVTAAVTTMGEESPPQSPLVLPRVSIAAEEEVYRYRPANNGAGPMWARGSTCIVRVGNRVFASGLETLEGVKPLNNCRWLLFMRGDVGWELVQADPTGRTREPCPLAAFPNGPVFLSANPTLVTDPEVAAGPARPEILQFDPTKPRQPFQRILPQWDGNPPFTEHSYRSFAADGLRGELILFQNVGYTHAEWTFRDASGEWSARGKLVWPFGTEYEKPQPIRVCYPTVALKDRQVHFCGVSDIVEPNSAWRVYKRELTGRDWDYDFRRLFYTYSRDITTGKFEPWVEIASRETTAGWITPLDLWVDGRNDVHILWTERAIDTRLREKFFPHEKQSHALNYAILREGSVVLRSTLLEAAEGQPGTLCSFARFWITPNGRLFVFCYVQEVGPQGSSPGENQVFEILPGGKPGPQARVPLRRPLTSFYSATPRAGSPPAWRLDLLGLADDEPTVIRYVCLELIP